MNCKIFCLIWDFLDELSCILNIISCIFAIVFTINNRMQIYKKKMDMVKKIILTDREAQRKILDTFGVTRMSLSYALNYKRNSDKCKQMRKMAMELGGILLEERREP